MPKIITHPEQTIRSKPAAQTCPRAKAPGDTTPVINLSRRNFLAALCSGAAGVAIPGFIGGCSHKAFRQTSQEAAQRIKQRISSTEIINEEFFRNSVKEIVTLMKEILPDRHNQSETGFRQITNKDIEAIEYSDRSQDIRPLFDALFELIQKFCSEPFDRAKTEDQKNSALKDFAERANIVSAVISSRFKNYPNPIQSSCVKVFEILEEIGQKFFPGENIHERMIELGYLANRSSANDISDCRFFIPIGDNNRKTLDLNKFFKQYPELAKFFKSIDPKIDENQMLKYVDMGCEDSLLARKLFHFCFDNKVAGRDLQKLGANIALAMVSVPQALLETQTNKGLSKKIFHDVLKDSLASNLKIEGKHPEGFITKMFNIFEAYSNLDRQPSKEELEAISLKGLFEQYSIDQAKFEADFKSKLIKEFNSPASKAKR